MKKPTKPTKAEIQAKADKLKTGRVKNTRSIPRGNVTNTYHLVGEICDKYDLSTSDIKIADLWGGIPQITFYTEETPKRKYDRARDILMHQYRDKLWKYKEAQAQEKALQYTPPRVGTATTRCCPDTCCCRTLDNHRST